MGTIITYHITALQLTIYFNKEGDHDHNGLVFALTDNVPTLKYINAMASGDTTPPSAEVIARASWLGVPLPTTVAEAKMPHPLIRPLALRCNQGDTVKVIVKNETRNRWVGLHLVSEGYNAKKNDGSDVGNNPHSLVQYNHSRTFKWPTQYQGVFTFHDGGNYSGGEDGTNAHGLFGALIVEPVGTIWRDPLSGRTSLEGELDGLYLDVIPAGIVIPSTVTSSTTLATHVWDNPKPYFNFQFESHREFVIFFHDEPEFVPPHSSLVEDPCLSAHGHHSALPIMPISYRAEPMVNREQKLFKLMEDGHVFDKPVLNEEQHHSSWMFGDPVTPILKAYIGDPVRIRFVHAGVKETHVFHLHLYEWHTVPEDKISPRIDAISVSPQTAHTIEPVWGAGNRHQVAGDIIWHCHLYPHFHEGMWGIFRTFETLQNGVIGVPVTAALGEEEVYLNRTIGQYPDGTPIERLLPLPDRLVPPNPTATHPGYPLYIPGKMQQKSPIPPWPDRALTSGEADFCDFNSLLAADMPLDFDYRAFPTSLERNAFNQMPLPGELFTRKPFRPQQQTQWSENPDFERNVSREVCHEVIMEKQRINYNGYGWHDKDGHLYYLKAERNPSTRSGPKEPLFFRALHGQILNLIFENLTPPHIAQTEFDLSFPPCPARPWLGECAMHVHMVKFDPVCADGAATGWNYISGPVAGKKMVYRWWLDQEFGTIFFHDHLFANYRQKHGLFGALLVEPIGSRFYHNITHEPIISGLQAVIERHPDDTATPGKFREFCIGIADFIPMWKPDEEDPANTIALNPPAHPGGHGDQGVMALNYRSEPIHERLRMPGSTSMIDPALWFSSGSPYNRDPYTTLFLTFADDFIWFRMIQGSHEEQHSFQIHGMRWQRFREQVDSALRNQQAFGLSEAFTFIHQESFGPTGSDR